MDEKHFDVGGLQIDGKFKGSGKKVFIKTYGCQMNVYDTQRMTDALVPKGYQATQVAQEADLIVLNTCHIREKAAEKVYSELGRMRQIKQAKADQGHDVMIGVAGCVAQAEGEEIMARAPVVDLVFGPQAYHRLPELLDKAKQNQRPVDTDFPLEDKFDHMPKPQAKQVKARGVTAFLTVQEGCDKFCTFCVVPYTRGAEVSRPVSGLIDEAKQLVDAGVREITLLGQNVNAYHGADDKGGTVSLAKLMDQLSALEGLDRLRYTTSHPRDMDLDLIRAHGNNPKVMPFVHLPVQSGSDRILKAMNRAHTAYDYCTVIDKIRHHRPDLALSGDFIVGFPGETDQDFDDTLRLVRDVGYAQAYSFKYSPRPGTPGAELGDQVAKNVADMRLQTLQGLLNEQQTAFNAKFMGQQCDVLFDKKGREPGQISGRSPYLQAVQVDGPQTMIGDIRKVRIVKVGKNSLFGELV